jgi:hypothetical protein
MSDGAFYGYILLLFVSGILLSVLAARGFGQSVAARVVDGLFSAGFVGYAFYLLFVFGGGQVRILFYAFIVPVLAVVKVIKAWQAQKAAQALSKYASAGPTQPAGFSPTAQPAPYGLGKPGLEATTPPPAAAYSAPVLTRTIGEPLESSPYGRYKPGQPIGMPPAAASQIPQTQAHQG